MKKVLNFFVKKHDLASITALMQNLKYNRNLQNLKEYKMNSHK